MGEYRDGLPSGGSSRGSEASTASQPATGGRSTWHDRRWFGRLEQEDQRLKKHDGRWMDIVWTLQLESFILTKLTKPLVHHLSRPTGQRPKRCAPDVSGRNHFFRVIRRQLIACGQASGGSRVGRGSLRGITAGDKRREQAVPPALV